MVGKKYILGICQVTVGDVPVLEKGLTGVFIVISFSYIFNPIYHMRWTDKKFVAIQG